MGRPDRRGLSARAVVGPRAPRSRRAQYHFDGFAAIWATTAALTGDEAPEQLRIGNVTSDFFSLLGADAALGRTFSADDESVEGATSILLSDALWRRRYGADPAIVGRRVDVNGRPTVVIGVMPAGFRLLMPPDAAVPDDLEAWQPFNRRFTEGPRGQRYLRVIGMRPGVSDLDAIADVARVGRDLGRVRVLRQVGPPVRDRAVARRRNERRASPLQKS